MPCHGCRLITHPELAPDATPLEAIRAHLAHAQAHPHPIDVLVRIQAAEQLAAPWPALRAGLCELRARCMAQRAARRAGVAVRPLDWSIVNSLLAAVSMPPQHAVARHAVPPTQGA